MNVPVILDGDVVSEFRFMMMLVVMVMRTGTGSGWKEGTRIESLVPSCSPMYQCSDHGIRGKNKTLFAAHACPSFVTRFDHHVTS